MTIAPTKAEVKKQEDYRDRALAAIALESAVKYAAELKVGDIVNNPQFGNGTVLSVNYETGMVETDHLLWPVTAACLYFRRRP